MKHLLFRLIGLAAFSCAQSRLPGTTPPAAAGKSRTHRPESGALARPAGTLIYQTKADYAHLVPVLLSADGHQIVSYPAPSDVRGPGSTYPSPVLLAQGYWLDQRGIGPNVGFLRMTYAEYARLPAPPSLAALQSLLVDRDPLVKLCDCGPRAGYATDPTAELNQLIRSGQLETRCKKLK
jgi:hypothetical protein